MNVQCFFLAEIAGSHDAHGDRPSPSILDIFGNCPDLRFGTFICGRSTCTGRAALPEIERVVSRICGVWRAGWSKEPTSQALDRLLAPLIHSPDFSTDRYCLDTIAIGRTYFATNNFSTHLFVSDDKSVICACTGYLFEPAELGKRVLSESGGTANISNPAALFAFLIPRHGPLSLMNLSGCYSFALWESDSGTLMLGTDRYGMIPLYYQQKNGPVAFASEIKSLLNFEPDDGINLTAFSELLSLGAPLGDHTLYPSVQRLPAATVLAFRNGQLTPTRYWSRGVSQHDPSMTVPQFVEEAQRLLSRSIARLTNQIAHPICFLSGGYDSRRILLELIRHGKPVTACTSPTVRNDNPWTHDIPIARALCAELGVDHVTVDLSPAASYADLVRHAYVLLDFETDSHPWVLPLLAKIRVGAGVNFDGLGGDVLFEYNYTYADEAPRMDDPAYLAERVLRRFPDIFHLLFRLEPPQPPLAERVESALRELPNDENRLGMFYFCNWTRRKASLFAHGLVSLKIDSVYPYLDYDLVDHIFRLPPLVRRTAEVSKGMLNLVNPGLMQRIPSSHDRELKSSTDAFYDRFRAHPPEHYWLDTQTSIHRAAAIDIRKAQGVLSQLSLRAQLAAVGNLISVPEWCMRRFYTRSSWRLRMTGMYALQRQMAQSRGEAAKRLFAANDYVYKQSIL